MNCNSPATTAQRTIPARIVLRREQLLYDIATLGYVHGDILPEEQSQCVRHQLQDITSEQGNNERITRAINLAVATLTEALYNYTSSPLDPNGDITDDTLTTPDTYQIDLTLPANASPTTLQLLTHLAHEYTVAAALAEWLSVTMPALAPAYAEKAYLLLLRVRTALTARTTPLRRRQSPF